MIEKGGILLDRGDAADMTSLFHEVDLGSVNRDIESLAADDTDPSVVPLADQMLVKI